MMLLRSTARPIIYGTSEILLRQRISFVSGRQAIFRRQSSSNNSSTSDDAEWIPPSRPLSGDQANYEHIVSMSHLSQTKTKKEEIEVTEETRTIVEATASRTSPYDTESSWVDYGEASTLEEGEDEEDDLEDIDISDEDLLNEENWIDPFERGNLSKHHFGETIDVDEWIKGMPSREEDFAEDEDLEGDSDDEAEEDQILKQWLNDEKNRQKQAGNTLMGHELRSNMENMTEEEIIASFKKHGTWIDLDQISADDLQRMVEEMKQNHPTSPSDTVPKAQGKGRKITTSKLNTGSMEKDEDIALIPDWTVARQKRLGRPSAMLTPRDARVARQLDGEIPIKFHTLLTCEEITNCLTSLGGWDVTVLPIPLDANMGKAIIVATGTSGTHLRTMADALVKSLRARKLHKMGVIGADSGAEGYDCDDWMAVDCRNYTVHLQCEITRKHIALDRHWSPAEVSKRRRNPIKFEDDDAADDFVNDNPIPDEYARHLLNTDASGTMSSEEAAAVNYLNTKKLQKTTMSPVVPSRRRPKGGKKPKGSKGKRGGP
jgi:ribosome-associated protein